MFRSRAKQFFVFSLVSVVCLLVLACSSQVPVSTTVGGAQVNNETSAPAAEVAQEPAGEQIAVDFGQEAAQEQAAVAVEKPDGNGPAPEPAATVVEPATEPAGETGEVAASVDPSADSVVGGDEVQAQVSDRAGKGAAGIVVSGSGKASSAPDLATLRLGVEAIEATVGEARSAAAEAMTAVMESVGAAGVEDKDVQTGYFSIQPRYTGREVTRCIEAEGAADAAAKGGAKEEGSAMVGVSAQPAAQECFQEYRSIITGYEVSNNLTVLVRDLETVDDVIDGAVDAGGDNIRFNGLSFSLDDTTELQSEARSAAVENMEAKAAELAGLAGVELGDLVYLTETGGGVPPVLRADFALARGVAESAGGVATPVSPGEISVQVGVVGQYLIERGEE